MKTVTGKIERGQVVLDDSDALPEGAQVTVVVHEPGVFELDDSALDELERRLARAQRGEIREYHDLDALKADLWSRSS